MARQKTNRPTLRDVASLAGVSHQTVSRVINGAPGVLPATLARVESAIQELDYRPHAIARSMAQGRTNTLACLAPNLTDFTYASNMEGAESVAREQGYYLLCASFADEAQFEALVDELVAPRRVDGLIVISPYVELPVRRLPEGTAAVLMGGCQRDDVQSLVYLDNHEAACMATRHLIGLGHRRIAQVTGPMTEDCAQERHRGYAGALATAGVDADPALVAAGDWSATSGYTALREILGRAPDVTAVVAQNDRMAVGIIRAARELGLRVPADLSVIGFDDMPLASYFDPPLTTMRQDTFAIGQACARLLIDQLQPAGMPQPQAESQQIRLMAELIVRESTAPKNERR